MKDQSRVEEETREQAEVTPYAVKNEGGKEIDYSKLIKTFGCEEIDSALLKRFQAITGRPPHHMLRRGVFFSHRDLGLVLDKYERGEPFYLYTGRGPSSDSLHVGHLVPFIFTKYLQEAFDVPLVIQITDDEKYFFRGEGSTLQQFTRIGLQNIKDILAIGFDERKTFVFIDSEYISHLYPNVCLFQRHINLSTCKAIFGLDFSWNSGQAAYPSIQAAPCISTCFPHLFGDNLITCLIPQGIDQDPYFRMARDVCAKFNLPKPACIHSKFIPSLQGYDTKMSSSSPESAIFVTDTLLEIKKKVASSLSGGRATREEQQKLGADLETDIAYKYLTFFLEDDAELQRIRQAYSAGKMMSSEVKQILTTILDKVMTEHRTLRQNIDMAYVRKFTEIRSLKFKEIKTAQDFSALEQISALVKSKEQDAALGALFGALTVDSLIQGFELAGKDGVMEGSLTGLGELILANLYGVSKMKKPDQIEKVADQYYHYAKSSPKALSRHELEVLTLTSKINKGFKFAPVFKQKALSLKEFDPGFNFVRILPAALFFGSEALPPYIQSDAQLTHCHQENQRVFASVASAVQGNLEALGKNPTTADCLKELSQTSLTGIALFSSIAGRKGMSKCLRVLLGAIEGKRVGFRGLPRVELQRLLTYKRKDQRKFTVRQVKSQIAGLLSKLI